MGIIKQDEVLTREDVETRLSHQYPVANKIVTSLCLSGWKVDHDINMSGVICLGTLAMGGVVIKGSLYIGGASIKDTLYLDGVEIEGNLILTRTSVGGNLDLENASIRGNLYLNDAAIGGVIRLSTKNGPKMIFVSPDMAELVHWAAPTIPLVVVR